MAKQEQSVASKKFPIEVLWCTRRRTSRHDGWAFPPQVESLLLEITKGKSVLQMFGGHARFGLRLDIDPQTRPDVLADAWLPPFGCDSFDFVILDPPYISLNQQQKLQLLMTAAWIAREAVVWFHTMWLDNEGPFMRLERAWLVRVGRNCRVRCIEIFRTSRSKQESSRWFRRGPQLRYNRWLQQPQGLAFGAGETPGEPRRAPDLPTADCRLPTAGQGLLS